MPVMLYRRYMAEFTDVITAKELRQAGWNGRIGKRQP
jgi:hypothetical protein